MRLPARAAAVVAVLTALPIASPAAAAAPLPCEAVGFSPSFATDRTMFCSQRVDPAGTGFDLFRSTDRGRTWQRRARVLPPDALQEYRAVPLAIYADGAYATSRTVYVLAEIGLYQLRDDGSSVVRIASGYLGTPQRLTPYRDHVPGTKELLRTSFVNAGIGKLSYVYDTLAAAHVPGERGTRLVPGAPWSSSFYIVPPDFADRRQAVAIGADAGVRRHADGQTEVGRMDLAAFACTGDFVCARKLTSFGHGATLETAGSAGATSWIAVRAGHPSVTTVYRSDDHGHTWRPWTSLNGLFDARAARRGEYPVVSVATAPDAPRRRLVRLSYRSSVFEKAPTTAPEQVFRSDDDGSTWRRVAYAFAPGQPGRRGNLAYNSSGPTESPAALRMLTAQPGGRLYVIGGVRTNRDHRRPGTFSYVGLFCSADLGRTWRRGSGC